MLDVFKKNKNKILRYGAICFMGALFIIQLPYWIGEHIPLIKTDFNAADVLSFLGDYISALGTVILGWIAVKQTDKANDISDRVGKLELSKYTEEHEPVILIDWVKLHDSSYNSVACKCDFAGQLHYIDAKYENDVNEERECIELNLINTGRCGIYNCKLEKISSQPEELKEQFGYLGPKSAPFNLKAGEELKFNLFLYSNVVERFAIRELENIRLVFSCVNDFNEKYKLVLDVAGDIKCVGNNRYEGGLIPTPHPVSWRLKTESDD